MSGENVFHVYVSFGIPSVCVNCIYFVLAFSEEACGKSLLKACFHEIGAQLNRSSRVSHLTFLKGVVVAELFPPSKSDIKSWGSRTDFRAGLRITDVSWPSVGCVTLGALISGHLDLFVGINKSPWGFLTCNVTGRALRGLNVKKPT